MLLLERQYKHTVALWPAFMPAMFAVEAAPTPESAVEKMQKLVEASTTLFKNADELMVASKAQQAFLRTCVDKIARVDEEEMDWLCKMATENLLLYLVFEAAKTRQVLYTMATIGLPVEERMAQLNQLLGALNNCSEMINIATVTVGTHLILKKV